MKRLAKKFSHRGVTEILLTLSFWGLSGSQSFILAQQTLTIAPSSRLDDRSAATANPFRRPGTQKLQSHAGRHFGHMVAQNPSRVGPPVVTSATDGGQAALRWQAPTKDEKEDSPVVPIDSKQDNESLPKQALLETHPVSHRPAPQNVRETAAKRDEPNLFHPPINALSLAQADANEAVRNAPLPGPPLASTATGTDPFSHQDRSVRTRATKPPRRRLELSGTSPAVRQNLRSLSDAGNSLPATRATSQHSPGRRDNGDVEFLSDSAHVSALQPPIRINRRQTELSRLMAGSNGSAQQVRPVEFSEVATDGEIPFAPDEYMFDDSSYACQPGCQCECCSVCCDACGSACCDGQMCEVLSVEVPRPRELTLFGGVHGFKGPLDHSRDRSNFGIHEGFNWGGKFPWFPWSVVGYQIGYQLVHSQLHGSEEGGTSDPHTQQFLTAGLFRRTQCGGWQYGVVWDMLRDERNEAADFHQIRGELGFIGQAGREFGFAFAAHTNDSGVAGENFRALDQYLLYYRLHAPQGGEARFYGGFDDTSKGILGANVLLPVHDRWSVQSGFTYVIPEENGESGAQEEAWNLGINLVWHFDARARRSHSNYYRPLFDVADNGSLIIDSRP